MLPDLNIKASEAPYVNIQIQRGFNMTDELIKHPVLPTWPTPAARILIDEEYRLKKVAENLQYNLATYKPYQDTLDCILQEHKKWRESVMNPTKEQEEEINRTIPYKSYGGPVSKPSKFWKILAVCQFVVIVLYLFVKLIKG